MTKFPYSHAVGRNGQIMLKVSFQPTHSNGSYLSNVTADISLIFSAFCGHSLFCPEDLLPRILFLERPLTTAGTPS